MELRSVAFADADALIRALLLDLTLRYAQEGDPRPGDPDFDPEAGGSPADASDFLPPIGIFLVAALDGVDVACGGMRALREGVGEIKRMYVSPAARGRGIARGLLRALVAHGRSTGLQAIWLETGTEQPEAMALYESEGFVRIAPYGHYADDPLTRCYGLALF